MMQKQLFIAHCNFSSMRFWFTPLNILQRFKQFSCHSFFLLPCRNFFLPFTINDYCGAYSCISIPETFTLSCERKQANVCNFSGIAASNQTFFRELNKDSSLFQGELPIVIVHKNEVNSNVMSYYQHQMKPENITQYLPSRKAKVAAHLIN